MLGRIESRFFLMAIFCDYCACESCEKVQDVEHKGL